MGHYNLINGYVGSKSSQIAAIKALFDRSCTRYVEPYCGGAAI